MPNEHEKPQESRRFRTVRIVNEGGAGHMTRVSDYNTGSEIIGVSRVAITIETRPTPPKAVIEVFYSSVDVVADAEITYRCPHCHKPIEVD